jgi:hypothetical protein
MVDLEDGESFLEIRSTAGTLMLNTIRVIAMAKMVVCQGFNSRLAESANQFRVATMSSVSRVR